MSYKMAFSKTAAKNYEKRYGCIPLVITDYIISLGDIGTCDYLYLSDIDLFNENFAEEYEHEGLYNIGFYQYNSDEYLWSQVIPPDRGALSDFIDFYFNASEENERIEKLAKTKTLEEIAKTKTLEETDTNIFTMQKDFTQQILSMVSCKEELKVIEKIAKSLYEMY